MQNSFLQTLQSSLEKPPTVPYLVPTTCLAQQSPSLESTETIHQEKALATKLCPELPPQKPHDRVVLEVVL